MIIEVHLLIMERTVWLIFFLTTFGLTSGQTSKILVLPMGMKSHINLFSILGKALKDYGHEVWMLAFDNFEDDIRQRRLIPLTFPLRPENDLLATIDKWTAETPDDTPGVIERWKADPYWIMALSRVCDSIMQNETIMTTIEQEKFDLVVFDGLDESMCHLMVPYKFSIPFVTVHGFQTTSWVSGVTGMPSLEPEVWHPFTNQMGFWQRLENLKTWLGRLDNFFYDLYTDHHMDAYCPPNKPKIPLKKVAEMAEMYLMNYEIMCLDYPRVSAPNMQYLGATTALPSQTLPKELENYIAGAEHGVILMSFGTMKAAHQIWKILGEKLFNAFSQLPQRVIVQYRLDKVYGNVPKNVKLVNWLPQNDLLGHKNVKLFITHGGNNGQNEAVFHGVPMLVFPIFTDQMYNGLRIEAHAYGKVVMDQKTITAEQLYEMMSEVINNKTYAKNIRRCSEIIQSMPSAQEKFVFWVNHILRFGGAHLRPPSLDMPLYQVLMLDIVAYYIICFLVMIHLVLLAIYLLMKYFRRSAKIKKE